MLQRKATALLLRKLFSISTKKKEPVGISCCIRSHRLADHPVLLAQKELTSSGNLLWSDLPFTGGILTWKSAWGPEPFISNFASDCLVPVDDKSAGFYRWRQPKLRSDDCGDFVGLDGWAACCLQKHIKPNGLLCISELII